MRAFIAVLVWTSIVGTETSIFLYSQWTEPTIYKLTHQGAVIFLFTSEKWSMTCKLGKESVPTNTCIT